MPLRSDRDASGKFLRVIMGESWPSPVEQAAMRVRLVSDTKPRVPVLIDLRCVRSGLTPNAVRESVATAVAQQREPLKRALLVATTKQERVAEQIRQLAALHGAEIRVFWEESAAVEWLLKRGPKRHRREPRVGAVHAAQSDDPRRRCASCPKCRETHLETVVQGTHVSYTCQTCAHRWGEPERHDTQSAAAGPSPTATTQRPAPPPSPPLGR